MRSFLLSARRAFYSQPAKQNVFKIPQKQFITVDALNKLDMLISGAPSVKILAVAFKVPIRIVRTTSSFSLMLTLTECTSTSVPSICRWTAHSIKWLPLSQSNMSNSSPERIPMPWTKFCWLLFNSKSTTNPWERLCWKKWIIKTSIDIFPWRRLSFCLIPCWQALNTQAPTL